MTMNDLCRQVNCEHIMTDTEIIKALECCCKDDCDNCPNTFGNCYSNLAGYALDLINRQQAEIERLKKKVEGLSEVLSDSIRIRYKEAQSEAVKEFADEFKSRCIKGGIYPAFVNRQLEIVKKEMVGEDNA